MSSDILSVLEYMEKEKGISRQDMIEVIVAAIKNAAQKGLNAGQELKIEINPKSGALKAWVLYRVVDSLSDPNQEMPIHKARQIQPEIQLGQILEKELDPSYLGRIAAQTARQAIMQRIRYFEKEKVFEDFKHLVGDIVSGTVRRRERSDLVIDLGKAEALLPSTERISTEEYNVGDHVRCLLLEIENTPRGPEIILSRSHAKFASRLLEIEVNEIADGTVSIKGLAREPGYRTKVAVDTNDSKVDPVGSCVGARGARVKALVRELNGEKVDILRYYTDPIRMLEEAFKPVHLKNIKKDDKNKRIYFEVADEDMRSVIGRKGQNVKLTSTLMGWRLEIGKENAIKADGFEQRVRRAVEGINQIPGLDASLAKRLVAMGITSPEAFEDVTLKDLTESGFTAEEAQTAIDKFQEFKQSQNSSSAA